jgi:hypothetical protein
LNRLAGKGKINKLYCYLVRGENEWGMHGVPYIKHFVKAEKNYIKKIKKIK